MFTKYTYFLHSENKRPEDCAETQLYKFTAPICTRDEAEHNCIKVYDNMYKYLNDPNRSKHLHEVIRGNRKIFFDIDAPQTDLDALYINRKDLQEEVLFYIKWHFTSVYAIDLQDKDIIICDSSDDHKFSQHIIITNYYVMNNNEAAKFAAEVKVFVQTHYRQFIDDAVYKPLQFLRLPNMQKVNSARIKRIITEHKEEDAFISQCAGCKQLPMRFKEVTKPEKRVEVSREEVVKVLELVKKSGHINEHAIRSVEGNMIIFRRLKASFCQICDREHTSDNTAFVTFDEFDVVIHCRRSSLWVAPGKSQVIRIPIKERTKLQKIIIPAGFKVEKYNEPQVREYKFDDHDTLIIRSNMGMGKTYNLHKLFGTLDPDYSIIFVSIRKSLTSDILNKFAQFDLNKLGFISYNEVEGDLNQKRLIVQYESLHRVNLANRGKILLILDESESVITQMDHVSIQTAPLCYAKFEWLCKHATKMICMDAFASLRTYTLCDRTRKNVLLSINKYCKQENCGTDFFYDERTFHNKFVEAVKTADTRRLCVAATSKKQAEILAESARITNPNLKIALYTATSDNKHELQDINKYWTQYDIVIFTPTITAGVSFEQQHFHSMFCYFNAKSCDVNTSIQMLGRVRNVASREYHVCIMHASEQYPTTIDELEKSMQLKLQNSFSKTDASIVKGIKLIDGVANLSMRDDGTGYEYKNKDTYYWLKLLNTLHRCQSIMNFANLFKRFRHKMGMKTIRADKEHSVVTSALMYAVKYQNKETEINTIANAKLDVIIDIHADKMTAEERAIQTKASLMQSYAIADEAVITPAFVKKYNKDTVKTAFRNLNYLNTMNPEDCNAALVSIINGCKRQETDCSVTDLSADPTPLKLSVGMNLLNNLCATKDAEFGLFSGKALAGTFEISKAVIDERFAAFQKAMSGNPAAFIREHFGADITVNFTSLAMIDKSKLINKIIYPSLGMKIKTKRTRTGKNENSTIAITDFKYDGARFVPAK